MAGTFATAMYAMPQRGAQWPPYARDLPQRLPRASYELRLASDWLVSYLINSTAILTVIQSFLVVQRSCGCPTNERTVTRHASCFFACMRCSSFAPSAQRIRGIHPSCCHAGMSSCIWLQKCYVFRCVAFLRLSYEQARRDAACIMLHGLGAAIFERARLSLLSLSIPKKNRAVPKTRTPQPFWSDEIDIALLVLLIAVRMLSFRDCEHNPYPCRGCFHDCERHHSG